MQGDWVPSNSPAFIGGAIGMLVGIALFGYGAMAMSDGRLPMPFSTALVLGGIAEAACCFFAIARKRIAWAFALSLNGTGFVVFLFGAPKVRDGFETNLAVGFIPCLVFLTITLLLSMEGNRYTASSDR